MTNWQSLSAVVMVPAIAVSASMSIVQPSFASTVNVSCQATSTVPQIVASPAAPDATERLTMLTFLPEYFSEKDAVNQCQTTATTLQTLYNEGGAEYLASDTINGLPTVCSVERRGMDCDSFGAQVLFTLSETADPSQALYDMLGSNFKQAERPDPRTVSRIYTRIGHSRGWWPF